MAIAFANLLCAYRFALTSPTILRINPATRSGMVRKYPRKGDINQEAMSTTAQASPAIALPFP